MSIFAWIKVLSRQPTTTADCLAQRQAHEIKATKLVSLNLFIKITRLSFSDNLQQALLHTKRSKRDLRERSACRKLNVYKIDCLSRRCIIKIMLIMALARHLVLGYHACQSCSCLQLTAVNVCMSWALFRHSPRLITPLEMKIALRINGGLDTTLSATLAGTSSHD